MRASEASELGGHHQSGSRKTMGAVRSRATTTLPCPVGATDRSRGAGVTEWSRGEACEAPTECSAPDRLRREGGEECERSEHDFSRVRVHVWARAPVRKMWVKRLKISYLRAFILEI